MSNVETGNAKECKRSVRRPSRTQLVSNLTGSFLALVD
jgi:hypothetical protein